MDWMFQALDRFAGPILGVVAGLIVIILVVSAMDRHRAEGR